MQTLQIVRNTVSGGLGVIYNFKDGCGQHSRKLVDSGGKVTYNNNIPNNYWEVIQTVTV